MQAWNEPIVAARALRGRALAALVLALLALGGGIWTGSHASTPRRSAPHRSTLLLSVDRRHPGSAFLPGTVGLSVDANELSSGHLTTANRRLMRLMRLLGPAVLRIGGGSVEYAWWSAGGEPAPGWATTTVTPADLLALRGFLDATGWRVLLGVDLGHFEPTRAADEAHAAVALLGNKLVGVEIGNEPNAYGSGPGGLRPPGYEVGEYLREAQAYRQALNAAAPGLAIYGPALSKTRWLTLMGASASLFSTITEHYYPTNGCPGGLAPALPQPTAAELLSPAERQQEQETLATLTGVSATSARPIMIGETGTGACHGNSAASPAFASALWALGWTLRAAAAGVAGVEFHGHFGVCGTSNQSPVCAPTGIDESRRDPTPRPVYYGMLAAARLERGRFVPVTGLDAESQLAAWATVTGSGKVTIAIEDDSLSGRPQQLSIPARSYSAATEQVLAGRSVDARAGVQLGGASVTRAGRWRPKGTRLTRSGAYFRLRLRPASAAIVTLLPKHGG